MNTGHKISIVMYHYVRNLENSRYPEIKGLDLALFEEQVAYLDRHYQVITMEDLIGALSSDSELPPKAALLTFDDAYIDHYEGVFPVLQKFKMQGSFFPPVKAITEHQVLDVNKIHFLLASVPDKEKIISDIFEQLNGHREEYQLESNDHYFDKLAIASRFDPKEVIFIKRLLQRGLPEELRNIITNILFRKYVSSDESAFSRELYLNVDQMAEMKSCGMHFGSHGFDHYWLGSLSRDEQEKEISKSLEFMKSVGLNLDSWTMCYPYGSFNADTVSILKEKGCELALTTRIDVANLKTDNRFELPRLDTNDIPKQRDAAVNDWYYKAD